MMNAIWPFGKSAQQKLDEQEHTILLEFGLLKKETDAVREMIARLDESKLVSAND